MKLYMLLSVIVACAIVTSARIYPKKGGTQKQYSPEDDYKGIGRIGGSRDQAIPIDDESDWNDDGILKPKIEHLQGFSGSDVDDDDIDWSNDSDFSAYDSGELVVDGDDTGCDQQDDEWDRPSHSKHFMDDFMDDWMRPQVPFRSPRPNNPKVEWRHPDTQNNQQRPSFFPSWLRIKTRAVNTR